MCPCSVGRLANKGSEKSPRWSSCLFPNSIFTIVIRPEGSFYVYNLSYRLTMGRISCHSYRCHKTTFVFGNKCLRNLSVPGYFFYSNAGKKYFVMGFNYLNTFLYHFPPTKILQLICPSSPPTNITKTQSRGGYFYNNWAAWQLLFDKLPEQWLDFHTTECA